MLRALLTLPLAGHSIVAWRIDFHRAWRGVFSLARPAEMSFPNDPSRQPPYGQPPNPANWQAPYQQPPYQQQPYAGQQGPYNPYAAPATACGLRTFARGEQFPTFCTVLFILDLIFCVLHLPVAFVSLAQTDDLKQILPEGHVWFTAAKIDFGLRLALARRGSSRRRCCWPRATSAWCSE